MARLWFSTATTTMARSGAKKNSVQSTKASTQHTAQQSPHHSGSQPQNPLHRPRLSSRDAAPKDESWPRSPRRRINSRDISRTYDGMYGDASDDLLPFECHRHRFHGNAWFLGVVYLTIVATIQIASLMMVDWTVSWTLTNVVHLFITLIYIHWLKGSLFDEQGEMNALTVWEQLEATNDTTMVRRLLLVLPTCLTYAACHFCHYDVLFCLCNILVWCVAILAKLPFMNGVRIFGINRTVGIDDEDKEYKSQRGKSK